MRPVTELLADRHLWWRIADPEWADPLAATFAQHNGGRWNPPGSYPTLYLNQDKTTARANMQLFAGTWPYEPEDLRTDTAPVLVGALLPRRQHVADAHSPRGVRALGLPGSYPHDASGNVVPHHRCQPVGAAAAAAGLRGVRCRAARLPLGAGRELAWFPATTRSCAHATVVLTFAEWFWT